MPQRIWLVKNQIGTKRARFRMKNSATGFLLPEENRIIENAMKFWGCSSKIEASSRCFMFMYFLLSHLDLGNILPMHSCQVHLNEDLFHTALYQLLKLPLDYFIMMCRDFILPEICKPCLFYPLFNLRNLLDLLTKKEIWTENGCFQSRFSAYMRSKG